MITTTKTIDRSIEPETNVTLRVEDTDWHSCHKYPIEVTIEFKWKISEWTAAGFEPNQYVGWLDATVEIELVDPYLIHSIAVNNETFFARISYEKNGPLLWIFDLPPNAHVEPEPKVVEEYFLHEVT